MNPPKVSTLTLYEVAEYTMHHLNKLGNNESLPKCIGTGICDELAYMYQYNYIVEKRQRYMHKLFLDIAMGWDKSSDSYNFPVPSSIQGEKGVDAYISSRNNKWDDSPYADNRRELCIFVAAELFKLIKNKELPNE